MAKGNQDALIRSKDAIIQTNYFTEKALLCKNGKNVKTPLFDDSVLGWGHAQMFLEKLAKYGLI